MSKLDEVFRKVPDQYRNKPRLRHDVEKLLKTTQTLQPELQDFVSGGRKVTLFYLSGVIPIEYKGAKYNIPVTIYFDPPYPTSPPRCFVTPTQGMAIKDSHPHVGANGMIFVPCLASWNDRTSSLAELCAVLASVFSQLPPVYATGQGTTAGPVVQATLVPSPRPSQLSQADQLRGLTERGLKERWNFVLEPVVTGLNEQFEKKNDLEAAAAKIGEDVSKLHAAITKTNQDNAELGRAEAELRDFVEKNAGHELDPDSLRDELDPDSKQVLTCLAQEMSLDAFLQALDELLLAKKITLDDFLREVRDAGRRKFMFQVQRQKATAAITALSLGEAAAAA